MRPVAVLTTCFVATLMASGLLEAHQSGFDEWPRNARDGLVEMFQESGEMLAGSELSDPIEGADETGQEPVAAVAEEPEDAAPGGSSSPSAAAARGLEVEVTEEDLGLSLLLPTTDPDLEPHVQDAIKFYRQRARPSFQQALQRRAELAPMVTKAFADAGIPLWLANIAMVESQYNPRARSAAGPAGMWQLQAGTARALGLRVGRTIDERLDPEKSTHAVVKLLVLHYREFNDWELALAAYSAGSARVLRAVQASPHADLAGLVRRGLLPSRVLENVAAVHAASRIAAQPEEHGFRGAGRDMAADLTAETRRAMETMAGQELF